MCCNIQFDYTASEGDFWSRYNERISRASVGHSMNKRLVELYTNETPLGTFREVTSNSDAIYTAHPPVTRGLPTLVAESIEFPPVEDLLEIGYRPQIFCTQHESDYREGNVLARLPFF